MAQITAALVKELREMTDAGMMECKKALVEAEGDMDKAVDVLRTRGLAAVAKKAGRATNEGTIVALTADDAKKAVICEVNCETDFVGTNEKFKGYATRIATAALQSDAADVEALKSIEEGGETVEAILTDAIHKIGENMQIARFTRLVEPDGAIATYIHGGGTLGVLVGFKLGDASVAASDAFKTMAKDIAMQVAADNPVSIRREDVPEDVKEHEMSIYRTQAAESGKPEAIQEKIATGRMEKYYKESCLIEEAFVKDPDQTVKAYIDAAAKELATTIEVASFVRYALGETN